MITHKECFEFLKKFGKNYSEKDCEKILDILKNFADIAVNEYFLKNGKSDNIYPGID
jgi:hypothetical protein